MERSGDNHQFPVIGIGASAGGLQALESFFSKIPSQNDIAYVVIQHLDPHHESMMESLLSKHTALPINVIEEGMAIAPNEIYLNPPNKNVAIVHGQFRLSEIDDANKGFFRIDHFFRSLAEDQRENAICIVLSGTGSDGTMGLREVKSAGGMTIVQDEAQAGYEGMPQSAISTGMVDAVLSTEQMANEISQYLSHSYMEDSGIVNLNLDKYQKNLQELFHILRNRSGHDFSGYKVNTIYRRIERRMALHQINKLPDYLQFIKQHKGEIDLLFKDLLITVTSFFRDPDAFEALKNKAIPELLVNLPEGDPIRIWVPACATGEEAYSIAILLVEAMEANGNWVDCKIFATDIDANSINVARSGLYPESIKADLSKDRLDRFFTPEDNQVRVKKQLRDMVVFAEQDLIKDPPFPKMDLISCRNLLIYMNQDMHKKLFQAFHYALNPNGLLFLGSSESASGFSNLFMPLDEYQTIYRKKPGAVRNTWHYPLIPQITAKPLKQDAEQSKPKKTNYLRDQVEQTILEKYSHPAIVVDENFEILYIYGETERYLALPKGKASFNVINIAREALRYQLISILREAAQQGQSIIRENRQLSIEDGIVTIDLIVHPLRLSSNHQQVLLVVFKEKTSPLAVEQATEQSLAKDDDKRLAIMEQELQSTRESLQATIEELESSNEELQSKNEELQSSIEELETSKEEAQSTNEELISVNSELKQKIADLDEANNDIDNLLASTEIATIFLNNELRIKRFTPAMSKIFNLIASDLGRPISDITSNINYENIYQDAKHVLDTLEKQEKEIQTESGRWYAVRIIPYRTTENMIDGVVITLVDITENKLSKEANRLSAVVQDSNDAITVIDMGGEIKAWNQSAEKLYGYTEEEALQMNISQLLPDERKQEMDHLLPRIKTGQPVPSYETERLTKTGETVKLWLTVSALVDDTGKIYAMATTEQKLNENKELGNKEMDSHIGGNYGKS